MKNKSRANLIKHLTLKAIISIELNKHRTVRETEREEDFFVPAKHTGKVKD